MDISFIAKTNHLLEDMIVPARPGTQFLAEVCCAGRLTADADLQCIIHECDHLKVWMANNEVIRAETKGSRS